MSYVPKYIIKRLIPMDGVKLDAATNTLSIKLVNVLSPLPLADIPGDFLDLLDVKIDGKEIVNRSHPELYPELKLKWKDQVVPMKDIKSLAGGTLPVGDELMIMLPNKMGFKVGEKHTVLFTLKLDSPIQVEFERTIA